MHATTSGAAETPWHEPAWEGQCTRWREGQCNQFQVMPHNLGKPTYSDALQWAHVLHNVMDAGVHLFDRQVTPTVSVESWTSTEGEEGGGVRPLAVTDNLRPQSPHLPGR